MFLHLPLHVLFYKLRRSEVITLYTQADVFPKFFLREKGLFWMSVTVDWIGPDGHGFCPFEATGRPWDMSQLKIMPKCRSGMMSRAAIQIYLFASMITSG